MEEQEEEMLRWDEAMEEIGKESDPIVRALLERVNALVVRAAVEQRRPAPPSFDYFFFISTLREFFSEKDELQKVLNGEVDDW